MEIILFLSNIDAIKKENNCKKLFEQQIIENTKFFYEMQAQKLILVCSLSEYLQKTKSFFESENERCNKYMNWEIKEKVILQFRIQMIINQKENLLNHTSGSSSNQKGLAYLLSQNQIDDVSLMFELFNFEMQNPQNQNLSHKDHLTPLAEQFSSYVKEQGLGLLQKIDMTEPDG